VGRFVCGWLPKAKTNLLKINTRHENLKKSQKLVADWANKRPVISFDRLDTTITKPQENKNREQR
jgi:hypothetical protein